MELVFYSKCLIYSRKTNFCYRYKRFLEEKKIVDLSKDQCNRGLNSRSFLIFFQKSDKLLNLYLITIIIYCHHIKCIFLSYNGKISIATKSSISISGQNNVLFIKCEDLPFFHKDAHNFFIKLCQNSMSGDTNNYEWFASIL